MIRVENLNKFYGDKHILRDVTVEFEKQKVTCILGPSGAGKSTLIRCLNQLEIATSGKIFYKDQNILDKKYNILNLRREIGMVFQSFNLFPTRTVLDNLTLPLRLVRGQGKETSRASALDMLEKVGLADKANMYPESLSGGQKQRVAIARSLAMNPQVILFDEPTSALDPELVGDVLDVMKQLVNEGMTMVVVTHEMGFAKEVSDNILFMVDGAVDVFTDTKSFFENPVSERAKTFISRSLK